MKNIYINLGQLIQTNFNKSVELLGFTLATKYKYADIQKPEVHKAIYIDINTLAEQFKTGAMSTEDFNKQAIDIIKNITSIQLSEADFDKCWYASHNADIIKQKFAEMLEAQKLETSAFTLVSATNMKDLAYIKSVLGDTSNDFTQIAGIPLIASCVVKDLDVLSHINLPEPSFRASLYQHYMVAIKGSMKDTEFNNFVTKLKTFEKNGAKIIEIQSSSSSISEILEKVNEYSITK